MIVRHFRILLQVNDLIEKHESPKTIEKKLKQHPFVIKKTSQQSRNFNNQTLEKIYQELLNIDIGTKTGKIKTYPANNNEFQLAIEQFIIHCCK